MRSTIRRRAERTAAGVLLAGLLTGAGPASAGLRAPGPAAALASGWGIARQLPGLHSLNAGGYATINSVSCPSPGTCAAGGYYADGTTFDVAQAFVANERHGSWGAALTLPGLGMLSSPGSLITSVACGSAGNCAAGGTDGDESGDYQALAISEHDGHWEKAIQVPGTVARNVGHQAAINSVSCPPAGSCAAGGTYAAPRHGDQQPFVVGEQRGTWHAAVEPPGAAALNSGAIGEIRAVSCPSSGNCAAVGFYATKSGEEGLVVDERNGHWGVAHEVTGLAGLNIGGAQLDSVSCPSAGNCAAGGFYEGSHGRWFSFTVSQHHGRWGRAATVSATKSAFFGDGIGIGAISCASAGNCVAGGIRSGRQDTGQAFVVTERNGRWGQAIEVPGTAALNRGGLAQVTSVSCASAGNCAAGGYYASAHGRSQAFVVSERNGHWGQAIEVPGTAALNRGHDARVNSVSCPATGQCTAAGFYTDGARHAQAFVVSQH